MTAPTAFDQYGLPTDPADIGQTPGALASAAAAKKAAAASRAPAPVADPGAPPAPSVQTQGDPFAIPSGIPKTTGLGQNDFGYDATVGPTAPAAAPAVANIAKPTVTFNATGQQLLDAGALRPESGPWSSANPSPMTDGSGALVSPGTAAATANIAAPKPAPVLAASTPSSAPTAPNTATNPANVVNPPASFGNTNIGASPGPTAIGATSVSGRPLGYGSMINGVRTFSDGSGASGIPRTMSDQQIAGLGKRVNIADAGIGGGIGSAAAGGTPDIGAFGGGLETARAPIDPAADAFARAQAAQGYAQRVGQANASEIANQTPGSVLGDAARNASVEADSMGGKKGAAYLASTLGALNRSADGGLQAATSAGNVGQQESSDNYRADISQQGDNARQRTALAADISKPSYQTDAQGNSFLVRGASATPVTGPDGQITNSVEQKNSFTDAYAKLYEQLGNETKPDPTDPTKTVPLTHDERVAQFNALTGGHVVMPGAQTPSADPSGGVAPKDAAAFLLQNPQMRAKYDAKYGQGAAAKVLGS